MLMPNNFHYQRRPTMKQSMEDQLTEIYCFVDDFLKKHPRVAQGRESNPSAPQFRDAAVIPLAMLQGDLGCPTRSQADQRVAAKAGRAFPHGCGSKPGRARWPAWSPVSGWLVLVSRAGPRQARKLFRMESQPIPVGPPLRHGRVRLLREAGAGFGKTQKGGFFGFKVHALVKPHGMTVGAVRTPAHTEDRDPARALAWATEGGLCLADWGDRGKDVQDWLIEDAALLLSTTAEATEKRAPISAVRERVERTFSQLGDRVVDRVVDRVFSRSWNGLWNGLWNTIKLKRLHLNLCLNGIIEA